MKRFWDKVDTNGPIQPHCPELGACWVWTASRDTSGYGSIRIGNTTRRATRISWMLAAGPIPDGLHVLHRCDNRACVKPAHLFLGTHQDNMADLRRKGRGRGKEQRGERHAMVKLTDAKVLEIRRRVRGGEEQQKIAAEYGVHKATLNDVVLRKTWTHLPEEEV